MAELDSLLTTCLEHSGEMHESQRILGLLNAEGGIVRESRLEFWTSSSDRQQTKALLESRVRSGERVLVSFGVGAGAPRRRWPESRFVEFGKWLLDQSDAFILTVGGPEDHSIGGWICSDLGERAANLCGSTTPGELAAVLEQCSLHVGNDSGPMHIAAAVGIPVIEISCMPETCPTSHPESPERFGPWLVPNIIVRPSSPLPPCTGPCNANEPHCILNISAEMVQVAAGELIRRGVPGLGRGRKM